MNKEGRYPFDGDVCDRSPLDVSVVTVTNNGKRRS